LQSEGSGNRLCGMRSRGTGPLLVSLMPPLPAKEDMVALLSIQPIGSIIFWGEKQKTPNNYRVFDSNKIPSGQIISTATVALLSTACVRVSAQQTSLEVRCVCGASV
jgi:hypothetical protein